MKVICHLCGVEFEKLDKEVRRQQKEGREYFFAVVVVQAFMLIKSGITLRMMD